MTPDPRSSIELTLRRRGREQVLFHLDLINHTTDGGNTGIYSERPSQSGQLDKLSKYSNALTGYLKVGP